MNFSASTMHDSKVITLTLAGHMLRGMMLDIIKDIKPLLKPSGPKVVVVDMSKVTCMDGLGITALIRLHKTVAAIGARIKLTGLSGFEKELCLLCQLDKIMDIDG
ncbi:MAG: STAS domain-containing protein [Negativicutes bacterium]|nr:STAS domain-containing protein [Negativicutes bacterium]